MENLTGSATPEESRPVMFDLLYEATTEDFLGYVNHVSLAGDFYRAQMERGRKILLALWVVLAALFALISRDLFIVTLMLVIFGSLAVVSWFTWPKRWRKQMRKMSERQVQMENPLLLVGPKHYEIDAASVRYVGRYSGGYVMWPAVMRVTSDEHAVYLHVAQATAHYLPRRAFASAEDFARFPAQAEAWRAAGQASSDDQPGDGRPFG